MKDDYSGLDPALVPHAKKYQEAQERFAAILGPVNDLRNPAKSRPLMRGDDPWRRTIDRLNANLPGASR